MIWLAVVLIVIVIVFSWAFRFHLFSFFTFLSVRFERRGKTSQLVSTLRENLIHERKKKIAGLEMILSTQTGGRPPSWERGDEIQPRYEYFGELVDQLKALVKAQRRNLMMVSKDMWLWAKLWNILRRIEKTTAEKKERSDTARLKESLARLQEMLDKTVGEATDRLSFTLNEVIEESVKIVKIEKSEMTGVSIKVDLDRIGETIRLSYDKSREWQRILTNLIRNAIEAVEAKQSVEGVVSRFIEKGREQIGWVKITTKPSEAEIGQTGMSDPPGVSIMIEDSGIGMDEATRFSFYKKGFTLGKESGLGLGVTEESVDLINRYGSWEIESRKGVGTKITININKEKAQQAELFAPEEKRFSRTKLAIALLVPLLVLIGLILLFTVYSPSRIWEDRNPALVKLFDKNKVVVQNKEGNTLWDREFSKEVEQASLTVSDLNKDGRNEVLLGTRCGFRETGYVYCFSSRGKELWRFALGAKGVFQVPSNRYSTGTIIVRDLNSDGETEILVGAVNSPWFPYQIAFLDTRGQLQTSYWHSGSINLLLCDDVDDDGIPEIVFGGVNNRLQYSAVLGILDHGQIWGQSPPYRDTSLAKAKEKIYVKFPFVRELGGENDMYSSVVAFIYAGKRDGSDVYHVTVADPGFQREYHLDEGLTHVKEVVVHPKYRFVWERMKREGMVDYDLSPEVLESWKEIEVWKDGVKVK